MTAGVCCGIRVSSGMVDDRESPQFKIKSDDMVGGMSAGSATGETEGISWESTFSLSSSLDMTMGVCCGICVSSGMVDDRESTQFKIEWENMVGGMSTGSATGETKGISWESTVSLLSSLRRYTGTEQRASTGLFHHMQ